MEQCEECGFGDGVHEKGCWMTLSRQEQIEVIDQRISATGV